MSLRDEQGPYFGEFGGRFVPEALIAALDELDAAYRGAKNDPMFRLNWPNFIVRTRGGRR